MFEFVAARATASSAGDRIVFKGVSARPFGFAVGLLGLTVQTAVAVA